VCILLVITQVKLYVSLPSPSSYAWWVWKLWNFVIQIRDSAVPRW